jgi:hypothetical protein
MPNGNVIVEVLNAISNSVPFIAIDLLERPMLKENGKGEV